ncbi:MAG: response regulator transcription factor [Actinobacteria bacterium]|nr:response regulator transcription factor [Actinomycetota bacterium]MCL5445831.1 response regulator transcription factor [Actinomycetota bacterium]
MGTRVFLLDDHEVVRRGLRDLIEADEDMEVVGEAATARDALARIPSVAPDVAVLDVRLPDGSGVEVCREVRSQMPDVYCLMLTSFSDDDALFASIMAGASGYLLKQIKGTELVQALKRVANGESLLDPSLIKQLMQKIRNESDIDERVARLTVQERAILGLIAEGKTNRQIAAEMFLAEKTVKNYVSNMLAKMGFSRRTEAAVYAVQNMNKSIDKP